ncbi:F-box only protein 40 [Cololabis saira]|uniref:F-box only protein 40 n=1 Tax=Cololabis saira TaxID=129043 RepID=UPI002AD4E1BF|nr:F-box only protein 40 [Cololabis saira]
MIRHYTVQRLFGGVREDQAAEEQRVKDRKMPAGYHQHCDKCHSVNCQVPVQIPISCMLIKCRKNCGAVFHMCKQEEHQLLCSHEVVPCLNADYGCPLTMRRHRLAKHLDVCPASVVCCSWEWNRWPAPETDVNFYKNISENLQLNGEVDLDVALALRDQDLLFQSIKMTTLFPEMMEEEPSPHNIPAGVDSPMMEPPTSSNCGQFTNGCAEIEDKELSQEEIDALVKNKDVESIQNYSSWEKIFEKEMSGCKQTVKNMTKDEKGKQEEQEASNSQAHPRGANGVSRSVEGATGLAPWQDGVLERLSKEANIGDYNMYLRHNGAMLINFGQLAACTPREKDFVYGNLEPIEVQTVCTFNVPTSYRAKRNHLKDPSRKAVTAHRSVDTADLGLSVEDLLDSEEIGSTLLCSLEKEVRGHSISESNPIDGHYVDVGTQTYNFPSAPFKADACLADITAGKPRGLHVQVEAESVTRRHNKTSSAFSYMCGHFFRRDEYCSHFRNAHCDIQASLSGWFQQRCPLAYQGCTFTQMRFHPAGQEGTIKFCRDVNAFVLQPHVPSSLCECGKSYDALSRLPLEILQHIAAYLDSFTLSQLSQVSHLMREVCASLLQDRGMVSLEWKKKEYSHGGSSWKCQKKVWTFSPAFSPVDRWSFSDAPSMSDHLKTCSFYQKEGGREPVPLPCLGEIREKHRKKSSTDE